MWLPDPLLAGTASSGSIGWRNGPGCDRRVSEGTDQTKHADPDRGGTSHSRLVRERIKRTVLKKVETREINLRLPHEMIAVNNSIYHLNILFNSEMCYY